MRTLIPAAQARTLAELVILSDDADLELDTLGDPGKAGPLLVDLGERLQLSISEAGICSVVDPGALA